NYYVIKALATQAYLGRRKDMFRSELIYALRMLQDGVRTRDTLTGSWAGAMGLTQFMPSEYYTLAYDLDGDGRADIWTSVPDALGSAANQLRAKGWVANQGWGYEVHLPKDVSCLQEGPDNTRSVAEWMRLGVERIAGAFPPQALDQQAFILTPAGAYGPAFLALENFLVIKRYNMSDLYALFVGNLGDRIGGGGAFLTPWADIQQLSGRGIEGIQEKLQTLGYAVAKIDGKAGMNTRALIGAYQKANGLKVDCWPTEALLGHVRAKAAAMGPAVKGADAAPSGGGALGQKPRGAKAAGSSPTIPTGWPLELELRACDVSELVKHIGAQGEAEPGPVWRVHPSLADIERLIKELPHHRHVALRDLKDVAVGSGHGHV